MIYGWKEKLNGSHKEYAKPEQIPPIIKFLEEMNEWLYGEGEQSNRGVYVNKINEVKDKISAIQKRYDTFENIRN